MKHIIKPALALFIIAAVTTTMLVYAFSLTKEPIANQRKKTQEKTMKAIFPYATAFREIVSEKQGDIDKVFESSNGDVILGVVVELSPSGYSGNIQMMVGLSKTQNQIAGIRILKHTETPGLGALSVKEEFYRKYDNRRIEPLRVIRSGIAGQNEIQAITGATITSRAITNAVNEAVEWYTVYYDNPGTELP